MTLLRVNKGCYSTHYNSARKHYDYINKNILQVNSLYCELMTLLRVNKSCYSTHYNTARKHYDYINRNILQAKCLYCEFDDFVKGQ